MKLQTRIIALILPLIVIPLCGLGWIVYKRFETNYQYNLIQQMDTTMHQAGVQILSEIQSASADMDLLANTALLKNFMITKNPNERYGLLQPAIMKLLACYHNTHPDYETISIHFPNGEMEVCSTFPSRSNVVKTQDRGKFLKNFSQSPDTSLATFIQRPDAYTSDLLIVKKLFYRDYETNSAFEPAPFNGFLVLTVNLNTFWYEIQRNRIGKNGFLCFVDTSGNILSQPQYTDVPRLLPDDLKKATTQTVTTGKLSGIICNGKRFSLMASDGVPDLRILSLLPTSELLEAGRDIALIVIGTTLIAIILTFTTILTGMKLFIVTPIQRLINGFREVSSGNIHYHLNARGKNEINRLAHEFNHMVDTLDKVTVSRDYLDGILHSMNDGLLVISNNARIETVNAASCSLTKFNTLQLQGMLIGDLFSSSDAPSIEDLIEQDSISNVEKNLVKRNGEIIPVLFSCSKMTSRYDGTKRFICAIRDISRIKDAEKEKAELEARLHHSKKMEALGTLAGGVAHDLNNILSGIVSYPQLLLSGLEKTSPLRKPLSTIQKSGEKAAAIVHDLLTLARRGVDIRETVNLNSVILEYLLSPESHKLRSFHPRVKIEKQLEPALYNLTGSPVHLFKTIMNLVSNAAEAMPDGGTIWITTENTYIENSIADNNRLEPGPYILLRVKDTGIGISSEDLERIFEPFYTKKKMGRSGTGLGMAVVWGTICDHNGYIDVKSRQEQGTEFFLYFPAVFQKTNAMPPQRPVENLKGNGEHILIVDDLKEQRELAGEILSHLGYAPFSVAGGDEAVEFINQHPVDLMIIDMIMAPGMDGLDTYRKVIEIRPGQKALIASGYSQNDRVKEALRLGIGAYVQKPYTIKTLARAIRSELDKT